MVDARIIIDSQSNPLFLGSEYEQAYDQRGGLCHGKMGDLVVTTKPYDPAYLSYWESLGFEMPELLVVGNGNASTPLSTDVLRSERALSHIWSHCRGGERRVEFFVVEEPEVNLGKRLSVKVYSNLELARHYGSKPEFRRLAEEIGLPLVEGGIFHSFDAAKRFIESTIKSGEKVLIKSERGTGGEKLTSLAILSDVAAFDDAIGRISHLGYEFLVEKLIPDPRVEVSLHWEIDFDGTHRFLGIYDQLVESHSYIGAGYPSSLDSETEAVLVRRLHNQLIPKLKSLGYVGYGCVDVNVQPEEHWMDFNPRKGAIRYIDDAVKRLFAKHQPFFWHTSFKVGHPTSIESIQQILGPMLNKDEERGWMVLATNPGLYPFGTVDLTGISLRSREEARERFEDARERLLNAV